jgi:hypothetical protein
MPLQGWQLYGWDGGLGPPERQHAKTRHRMQEMKTAVKVLRALDAGRQAVFVLRFFAAVNTFLDFLFGQRVPACAHVPGSGRTSYPTKAGGPL